MSTRNVAIVRSHATTRKPRAPPLTVGPGRGVPRPTAITTRLADTTARTSDRIRALAPAYAAQEYSTRPTPLPVRVTSQQGSPTPTPRGQPPHVLRYASQVQGTKVAAGARRSG